MRCKACGHKPRRNITLTRKTNGKPADLVEPRRHKKPCDCRCHVRDTEPPKEAA